jgi:hypothetical protein
MTVKPNRVVHHDSKEHGTQCESEPLSFVECVSERDLTQLQLLTQ